MTEEQAIQIIDSLGLMKLHLTSVLVLVLLLTLRDIFRGSK